MEDIIYFDRFAKKYTKTKENIAPSEKYIEIIKSSDDYYIEIWTILGTLKFSLSYSELDKKYASVIREEKTKKENVVLDRQLI